MKGFTDGEKVGRPEGLRERGRDGCKGEGCTAGRMAQGCWFEVVFSTLSQISFRLRCGWLEVLPGRLMWPLSRVASEAAQYNTISRVVISLCLLRPWIADGGMEGWRPEGSESGRQGYREREWDSRTDGWER
jgi:hypothetical protein